MLEKCSSADCETPWTITDRDGRRFCLSCAALRGNLAPSIREAIGIYRSLPHWVTDRLDLDVLEVSAYLSSVRHEGTTDGVRDELIDMAAPMTEDGHQNAGDYFVNVLDRVLSDNRESILDSSEEKTKVERMRCRNCGSPMCEPGC